MKMANIRYIIVSAALCLCMGISAQVRLTNDMLDIEWSRLGNGYAISRVSVDGTALPTAKYGHRILYSSEKPSVEPMKTYDASGREISFPDPQYRYIIATWEQNNTPVALNRAGENKVFCPTSVTVVSERELVFGYEDESVKVEETWTLSDRYPGDIDITVRMTALKDGWWSMTSPSVVSLDKYDFRWATVPGVYQGNALNPDHIHAVGYGHGIPDMPVVSRERTASTLTSIITDKTGITVAMTASPGTARDPWENDRKTHSLWQLGLSLMNRDGEFTPTLYHPVLGEKDSYMKAGETRSFSFTCTFARADWHHVFKHAVNDIYRFPDALKLKKTSRSLTQRLYDMHAYLVNDSTSKWHNREYKGTLIGAQDYLGGVFGSEKDAMKNSDYGAMWMLAEMTEDPRLTEIRLPYAMAFKKMQQHKENDFLYGSSAGQYYLWKSGRFTEEWGPYTEPVATTYYMLMDMGSILLFEPHQKELKENLRLAADCLLRWQKDDGSWEVAYDNVSLEPMFTDLKDLRPTFYGLLVAYRILGDEKYLDGAKKGADWYVENAVEKGHFLGVCGDTRFAPDFATIQSAQALLDLYDITGTNDYLSAALESAEIYTTSVYTHPIPTREIKKVKGVEREDWEIAEAGLSFEHGGVLGSANHRGPILLASHAGMFVRMFSMTADSLYLNMARSAAIGRDAFVDMKTGVASYYWDSMNNGAGPYPHHAWWQVGWITDYLISEAQMRSKGEIFFPGGFITPKVGPHKSYGFATGKVYGADVQLIMKPGLVKIENPYIEYLTAWDRRHGKLLLILMNNDSGPQCAEVEVGGTYSICGRNVKFTGGTFSETIGSYGLKVLTLK